MWMKTKISPTQTLNSLSMKRMVKSLIIKDPNISSHRIKALLRRRIKRRRRRRVHGSTPPTGLVLNCRGKLPYGTLTISKIRDATASIFLPKSKSESPRSLILALPQLKKEMLSRLIHSVIMATKIVIHQDSQNLKTQNESCERFQFKSTL